VTNLLENISLAAHNTFGMRVVARYFARFKSLEDLSSSLDNELSKHQTLLILGGGSNILFTKDFDGLILKNELCGREVLREDNDHVWIRGGAGENWHEFVQWAIELGFAGIENLSLIPGSLGASPMQNIGAYGVELSDHFDSLEAYHIQDREVHTFKKEDCNFGYRESVFKRKYRNQYVITSVVLKLSKKADFRTFYGAIQQELEKMNVSELSIRAVSDAVMSIRRSKLPDPAKIGNAGSFFKNPVIEVSHYNKLKIDFPDIISYPSGETMCKVAAGWLIEKAGWKGRSLGNYGVYTMQALVLVNYGGATGAQIYNLSQDIIDDIQNKFGIILEREVNIY